MHPSGSTAASPGQDLPTDGATLYPEADGWLGRRAKERRARLLAGLAATLRRGLAPGEPVRYVAQGVRHHPLESFFGGALLARYGNLTALVLTDRRLVLLEIDSRGRPRDLKSEIPLGAIRRAGRAGLGGFRLTLADGSKLSFLSFAGRDRKQLVRLLPATEGPRATVPSLGALCPACVRPVPGPVGATLTCPQLDCRIPFRDPRRAARLSALVPGLGTLYLRRRLVGAIAFLVSMLLLGVGLAFLATAAAEHRPAAWGVAAAMLLLTVGLPRLIDSQVALHHGRKGLVPLALAPAPGAQARNLPSFPRWSPLLFLAGLSLAGAVALALREDLRRDAAVREASELARQGRFDDALARWEELRREGGGSDERRIQFALALLESGDLEDADELRRRFGGAKVEKTLADRWNAALAREQTALTDYREGLQALLRGDPAGWTRVDRALAYFQTARRPHLPRSRGEVSAHLAMRSLGEPLTPEKVAGAARWIDGLGGAPPAEEAAVRLAWRSARGELTEARAALSGLPVAELPASFQLLVLEARARLAADEAERAAVRRDAGAFPRDLLDEREGARLDALAGPGR